VPIVVLLASLPVMALLLIAAARLELTLDRPSERPAASDR
jgi:Tfp pilus assembly protein PilX